MVNYFKNFPTTTYNDYIVTDVTRRVKIIETLRQDPYAFLPYTVKDGDRPEDIAYYYYGDMGKVWMVYLANNIIDPYTQWPMSNDNLARTLVAKYSRTDQTFTKSAVSLDTNIINIPGHGFKTTDPVYYIGTYITGLTNGSSYYVIFVDADNIKLASSVSNALNGTEVNITAVATGTNTLSFNVDKYIYDTQITSNIVHYRNTIDPSIYITPETYTLDTTLITPQWTPVRVFDYEHDLNESKRSIWLINNQYANRVQTDLYKVINV